MAAASASTGIADAAASVSQTVNGNCDAAHRRGNQKHDAHDQERARTRARHTVMQRRDHPLRDHVERERVGNRLSGGCREQRREDAELDPGEDDTERERDVAAVRTTMARIA